MARSLHRSIAGGLKPGSARRSGSAPASPPIEAIATRVAMASGVPEV